MIDALRLKSAALAAIVLFLAAVPFARAADHRVTSGFGWRAITPFGNLEGQGINAVGQSWEATNPGWNSDLNYTEPGWHNPDVWFDYNMWGDAAGNTPSYYRRTFTLDGQPISGLLDAHIDDDVQVWVNGHLVYNDTSGGSNSAFTIDVTPLLRPGVNLLAAKSHDSFGAGQHFGLTLDMHTADAGTRLPLVPRGSEWRYQDAGVDQGTAWRSSDFDDSTWKTGNGEFGYGDGDEQTVIERGAVPVTSYFRRDFDITDPVAVEAFGISLLRDDGVAVYLNGVEVLRENLAANAAFDTLAPNGAIETEERRWITRTIDPRFLLPGRNVLAVEIHQVTLDSTDVSFELQASAVVGRHRIAYTNFDEPGEENTPSYVPGPGAREIGFHTEPGAPLSPSPLFGVITTNSALDSPILSHRGTAARTTFDAVDLTGWHGVSVSLLMQVRQTEYEDGDLLTVYVTNGQESISIIDEDGQTTVRDALDVLAGESYQRYEVAIPDGWSTAQLVIETSSNSTSDVERFDFDSVEFRGTPVPEPASWVLGFVTIVAGAVRSRFRLRR